MAAGAAAGAALALEAARAPVAGAATNRIVARVDFTNRPDGQGWGSKWVTVGVANLLCAGGEGLLEAGSDVFPNDPRPVAFALDRRLTDARIAATLTRTGSAPGVVLRRRSPRAYYAAIYDTRVGALLIMRRDGVRLDELARTAAPAVEGAVTLMLDARGTRPTALRAELLDGQGQPVAAVTTRDSHARLQRAGEPGVLATAETLVPSDANPVLPALGNLHLLPWGVQEGQAFMANPVGQEIVSEIRTRSTAAFREIAVSAPERPRHTGPSVIAATTGRPVAGGAVLQVASDTAARVAIELSYRPDLRDARTVGVGSTGRFLSVAKTVRGLEPGRRVYWRAVLTRRGRAARGPIRSFRVPPRPDARRPYRIAVAACGAQFGPIFDHLADARPDVFVWQGDLNYPDTHGPLAQTTSAYAGIWRDFLANPLLVPLLERTAFACQRDDHDYGAQDANAALIKQYPWGLAPWTGLMNRRPFYRFAAGAAEVWVLDQRLNKSDPESGDGPAKTLLGQRQRRWLLQSLATSPAAFKVICSPCTVFIGGNSRDGNWSNDFEAERDLILDHIRKRVSGTTIFLTGDTHLTGVYEGDEGFECRAAPVGIPTPNDITLTDPFAAQNLRGQPGIAYAGDQCHLTLLEVRGRTLDLRLLREDGEVPYERTFTPSRAARTRAR